MEMELAISTGLIIGLVLGLTGAGGSIVAVPLFMLLLGLSLNDAIGLALGTVAISAFISLLSPLGHKPRHWKLGLALASLGMLTAPWGRWLGAQINEQLLLTTFTLLVIYLGLRMWRQPEPALPHTHQTGRIDLFIVAGLVLGFLSGLFGIGGGFLIIPLLTLYMGVGMKEALGTSLLVIALVSSSGFISHITWVAPVPLTTLFVVSSGSIAGIIVGAFAAKKIAVPKLQKVFALSVIGLTAISFSKAFI